MTQEEFEEWLEEHRDEALARIDSIHMSLPRWIKMYGQALSFEMKEEMDAGTDADEDDEDDGELVLGEED